MRPVPRILPIIAVTIGGVLAINALSGVRDLPQLMSGAKAFAQGVTADKPIAAKGAPATGAATVKPVEKPAVPMDAAKPARGAGTPAQAGEMQMAANSTNSPYSGSILAASKSGALAAPATKSVAKSAAICAPTAAELAKAAGMSPAELQILQNLGTRRGQLDQREKDLDVQLQLLAAAEAKLDGKIKSLNGLKGQVQSLIGQADAQQQAENDRLIRVYEAMKPKDAAERFSLLGDSVRIPIALKMKEKSLSAILAQMSAPDAKALTERLANRLAAARSVADARAAVSATPPATPAKPAAAAPARAAPRNAG
jgi:flagellar motility protein MotE (MotC chaperone)